VGRWNSRRKGGAPDERRLEKTTRDKFIGKGGKIRRVKKERVQKKMMKVDRG